MDGLGPPHHPNPRTPEEVRPGAEPLGESARALPQLVRCRAGLPCVRRVSYAEGVPGLGWRV